MTANLIQPIQIKRLQTILSKKFNSRDEKLDFLSTLLKREVTSSKELSKIEADETIYFLNKGKQKYYDWGYFDSQNNQHRTILSLCRQAQWVVPNDRHGEVPDLNRLSIFLKSPCCPVNKPLKKMTKTELSKVIVAFEGIVKHKYS